MRYSIPAPLIIAALMTCRASARYLPRSANLPLLVADPAVPTPTQAPHVSDLAPPETTPAPSNAILELLLRRQDSSLSSSNTWDNANTCGWYSGISSKPFTCESPLTCATNTDHVVACSTAGLTEFHTVCLNFEAVQSGKCSPAGPKTQCCSNSASPACGTMLWTGLPQRTMFACVATATAIAMLDEPQFVVDAASSSAAAVSSSAAAASSSSAAAAASRSSAASASSAAAASRASELGGSSVTITTTLDGTSTTFTAVAGATGSVSGITIISSVQYTMTGSDGSSTTYTAIAQEGVQGGSGSSGSNGSSGGSGGNNTAAIAGGVVGGILGLLLMLLLLWYLMRKKSNKFSLSLCGGKKKTNKEKHVHNKNNVENDNRQYNEEKNSTYRNSSGSPGGGGGGGGGFSLFGGASKDKSKKEKNITKNYYYGDEVRNDNRSYDKRAWKDNRKYNTESDSHSRTGTPNQQPQNFHFNIDGQGRGDTTERAASGGRHSTDISETLVGVAAVGSGRRNSSRRRQQVPSRSRGSRAQSHDDIDSRSPSPSHVGEAATAGTTVAATSRRDKRKMQRKQARGDYSPEPYSSELQPEFEPELAGGLSRRGPEDSRDVEVEHDDGYRGYGGREPAQPQHVHVHVHVHDRGSQDQERERDRGRSLSSRRDRRHDYYEDEDDEDDLEEEERLQERERGGSGAAHRYHPNSGRRNVPVSRSPSPPPADPAPHPDDFIGRGL